MRPRNALPEARHRRFSAAFEELTGRAPAADAPLGLAVSGGPDSVALLILADRAYGPQALRVATVDHGLRQEAQQETAFVSHLCAARGIAHATLSDPASLRAPRQSVQAWARGLRYRLLGDWAAREQVRWVATAHHADDQAETFLMRAARGAGVSGLAGIRSVEPELLPAAAVVRPLLRWRRAELADIVATAGITPFHDPSNRNPAYDRTVFRALIAEAPRLDPAGLAAAAAHAAAAEAALAWTAAQLWAERAQVESTGISLTVTDLPREHRRRLVEQALATLAPDARPRGPECDRLLATLEAGGTATLAGVKASAARASGDPSWRFTIAPPRRNAGAFDREHCS